jgi:hypothetical protein
MTDEISYKVPGWFFGKIINTLIVKRKLYDLFKFRREKLKVM